MFIQLWLLVPFFGIGQPAEKACFSVPGGFYEDQFTLEISPFYPQHHIRFTTNGNRPTAQSRLYTGPLLLDGRLYSTSDSYTIQISPDDLVYVPETVPHGIVIRAAVFDENEECISEVTTQSYFIRALGCDTHGLPVVSLCADSLDLFDQEYGIFVPGVHFDPSNPNWTGNYYMTGEAWERPINVEFYEQNNEGINQQAGLRTHGGNGRRFPQKCMKLYAREAYGKKRFEHRFFDDLPQNSFKHLVLKPFAASWNDTGVNDHISNQIAAQLNVESLASRPVILYLNGEYWGIYYIHERPDERYLEDHFDVDITKVNLLSGWNPNVDCGVPDHFNALFKWLETVDLSDPQAYGSLQQEIDLDNFIDWQILELFLENKDWPSNNMRCWQQDDGPWRWIFFDGDACMVWNTTQAFDNAIYVGDGLWPSSTKATLLFRKLLENDQFKNEFKSRFYVLLSNVFRYANTGPMFNEIKQQLEPEIPLQSDRFAIPESVSDWNDNMQNIHWFLMKRGETILPLLDDYVQDTAEYHLLVSCLYPNPSQGEVKAKITSDAVKIETCILYDLQGRQVSCWNAFLNTGTNVIDFDLPATPGVYFLRIGSIINKIVRQ